MLISFTTTRCHQVSQLFQTRCPDLEEIKQVVKKAAAHGSDGAKYFLIILEVLTEDWFSMDKDFNLCCSCCLCHHVASVLCLFLEDKQRFKYGGV